MLEPYETISDAVAGCLQEHYPHVMSADDILKYYYPEGLTGETKTRAYGAFSNTLSKGAGKKAGLKKVSVSIVGEREFKEIAFLEWI